MRRGFMGVKFMAAWLLAAAASCAHAVTTFCVGDVAHLNSALVHAKGASDTTVIQLVQGTWNVGSSELTSGDVTHPFQAVKLLGGYDGTCSNRTLVPANTVIDAGGVGINLFMQGSLTLEGLHFQNTPFVHVDDYSVNGTGTVVRNNEFPGVTLWIAYRCSDNGAINVDNNLVYGTSGTGVQLQTFCYDNNSSNTHTIGTDTITLTNNTVSGNAAIGIQIDSTNAARLYNNISWGNGQFDVYLRTGELYQKPYTPGTAYFDDNTYYPGNFFGDEASGSTGTETTDPLFVNPAAGDYHLQTQLQGFGSNSPAVNSGDPGAPNQSGVDLDGNPRLVGSAPDRGAYETAVDDTSNQQVVTNLQDSGAGSLREAIANANAAGGTQFIDFNIPTDGSMGSCPYVISLNSDLPYVSAPSLYINGFSQPGSKKNTYPDGDIAQRCIVLDGEGRSQSMGLTFYGASSAFYLVQGLAFEGWGIALNMSAGQNNVVWGNQFGGSLWNSSGSTALASNGIDVWLWGATTTTSVGGTDPSNRNIIDTASSNSVLSPNPGYDGRGIAISSGGGSNGNAIVNNLIGLDAFETTTSYGNEVGIQVETANNTVSGNVIGNNNNGIQVLGAGAAHNAIINNLIGITEPLLCILGPCPPPNAEPNQAGIYFWQGANANLVVGNTVTNNTLFGIELTGSGTAQNDIIGNSIYGNPAAWATNGAEVNLDGYAYGTTFAFTPSPPPNNDQNYPIINSVVGSSSSGTLTGYLAATNNTYTIQAFSSPTCEAGGAFAHYPVGLTVVGNEDATHHYDGTGSISFTFNSPIPLTGRYITASATDSNGNTSQFSACKLYQCDVIFRHGFDTTAGEKCP